MNALSLVTDGFISSRPGKVYISEIATSVAIENEIDINVSIENEIKVLVEVE